MLLGMKSTVEACRALALYAAHQLDLGAAHPDEAVRAAHQLRGDLLIPIVKGFCTESGIEIASVGIQVHGGMGYVEETGAAQTLRDVRITSIYEGTTGIQSNDLIGRKFGRDRGAALLAFIDEMEASLAALAPLARIGAACAQRGAGCARPAAQDLGSRCSRRWPPRLIAPWPCRCHSSSSAASTIGGWLMARAADIAAQRLVAGASDREFFEAKLATAHFYASQVLPQVLTLEHICTHGSDAVSGTDVALI